MAKCDITVHLDNDRQTYAPGDEVRGTVQVNVNSNCQCKALDAKLEWYTHGRGNKTGEAVAEATLFRGEFRAGAVEEYPFAFALPTDGPHSYQGHYLNVDWRVHVRADVPWAIDPKGMAEIAVPAPERPLALTVGPDGGGGMDLTGMLTSSGRGGRGILLGAVIMLGVLPLLMSGFVLKQLVQGLGAKGTFGLFFAIPFIVLPLFFVTFLFRRRVARVKLGKVDSTVEVAADRLACSVRVDPQAPLNNATATLRVRERVISGSGTNRTTHTHELHSQQAVFESTPSDASLLRASLQIPAGLPPSFSAKDNNLEWTVTVHLDIPRWPDWRQDHLLLASP